MKRYVLLSDTMELLHRTRGLQYLKSGLDIHSKLIIADQEEVVGHD